MNGQRYLFSTPMPAATRLGIALLVASVSIVVPAGEEPARTADIVLHNGLVYTMDAARTWAEAVAIADGRIVYVGPDAEAVHWTGSTTRVLDLHRGMLLPGFHDSHVHPLEGGVGLSECRLQDCANATQIVEAVRRYAGLNPGTSWLRGRGWALPAFEKANPTKDLLDGIVPHRPVALYSADHHSLWVNSRALELAGITRETPDPEAGRIERDAQSGEPSGTLRESAMALVEKHLPPPSANERKRGLLRALEFANSFGITSVVEARCSKQYLETYAELNSEGALPAYVTLAMSVDLPNGTNQVPELARLNEQYSTGKLRVGMAKLFVDGVIEAHTAALLEPYVGSNGETGKANIEPGRLNPLVAALDSAGLQIHIHAIGDRAIRTSLDALEHARAVNGRRDSRHTVAHLQLFEPQDIPRFRELGVVANFQALWAYADRYITDLTIPVLGPKRARWLYPIRSLANSGAIIVGGSDWSVTSLNPMEAIAVAMTRRDPAEGPGPGWIPEERVDLPTMLAAYTINGAYLTFREKETGSIEVGKWADLTVLDRNLFAIQPHEVAQARVLLTLLQGQPVYRAPDFETSGW